MRRKSMNLFVVGNSGAGKSTLAKRIAAEQGLVHVDLDQYAWAGVVGERRDVADAAQAVRAHLDGRVAIIEGMYADLVGTLIQPNDVLVWMDLPLSDCIQHCKDRPFEPHKWESAEKQDAFLPQLLEFLRTYEEREDALGAKAHRSLFDAHPGIKMRLETATAATGFKAP